MTQPFEEESNIVFNSKDEEDLVAESKDNESSLSEVQAPAQEANHQISEQVMQEALIAIWPDTTFNALSTFLKKEIAGQNHDVIGRNARGGVAKGNVVDANVKFNEAYNTLPSDRQAHSVEESKDEESIAPENRSPHSKLLPSSGENLAEESKHHEETPRKSKKSVSFDQKEGGRPTVTLFWKSNAPSELEGAKGRAQRTQPITSAMKKELSPREQPTSQNDVQPERAAAIS